MKFGAIPRSIWATPRFRRLSANAKLVYLFLLSAPAGNSAALFFIAPDDITHACGLDNEAAKDAIEELRTAKYLDYDDHEALVWLETHMRLDLGIALKASDKRVPFLQRLLADLPEGRIKAEFLARYRDSYHLRKKAAKRTTAGDDPSDSESAESDIPCKAPMETPCKAASKAPSKVEASPHTSQDQSNPNEHPGGAAAEEGWRGEEGEEWGRVADQDDVVGVRLELDVEAEDGRVRGYL